MESNIIQINYQDKLITLIPTAHVSKNSVELVNETIDEIKPDCICIELDQDRYNSLTNPEKYRQTDIVKIIKNKQVGMMLVNLILANYQRKLAVNLNNKSGSEMLAAIEKSKELNTKLVLADRNIKTTFSRIWSNQNFFDKIKLLTGIISAIFDDEDLSEEDIAQLQDKDMLNAALNEISQQFPKIKEVLVDERDKYLAYKIKNAPGKNIVAVLGAAHCVNVPNYINQDYSIAEFDKVKEKTIAQKMSGWIIPVIIVIAIALCFKVDSSIGIGQIKSWIIINGSLSAIGVIVAGGHLISAIVAFIAAPITSLNPLLAAGWFAGLLEAKICKPTVADFDSLNEDLNTFKGFRTNKVTKILLVVALANLGSTIGTFVAGLDIIKSIFTTI